MSPKIALLKEEKLLYLSSSAKRMEFANKDIPIKAYTYTTRTNKRRTFPTFGIMMMSESSKVAISSYFLKSLAILKILRALKTVIALFI